MILFYPRSDIDQGLITATRAAASDAVQKLAASTNTGAKMMARPLRPTDINGGAVVGTLDNPAALVADTYLSNVFPNFRSGKTQGIAILGIAVSTVGLDEIRITVGADPLIIAPLGEIQALVSAGLPTKGYFVKPVYAAPDTQIVVDLLSHAGAAIHAAKFMLFGLVGEKIGDSYNLQELA